MSMSSAFFRFNVKAIALAAAAIVIIHLAANVTITTAQQEQEQQQPLTSQPTVSSATQNGTTATTRLFENTNDNFRVQIPEGWVVRDVNNTGYALAAEVTQGYGILAQLCPEGEEEGQQQQQQQQGALTNASGSSISGSCKQQPQGEIVHIIRYPNLGARLGIAVSDIRDMIPDSILEYEIQKLREVGYRDINIVNSTDTALLLQYPSESGVRATVPAKLVEMAYSTSSAPNELRTGYFILTATNGTPPNLESITGYSIFYEGVLGATTAATTEEIRGSISLSPPPTAVRQIVNSFELMASKEAVRAILTAIAEQRISSSQTEDVGEEPSELALASKSLDTTRGMMIIAYSLLVIGVVWKFIGYMRENRNLRLDEIS
jgi:hypothetical protein